jgi:environmental stress-induced protein Ves
MTLNLVHTDDVPPQAWRNGGGTTRELLCWPSTLEWAFRVSVADITRDGPFSSFPGIERWFAVIEGAGVVLSFGGKKRRVRVGDLPLQFNGGDAPGCRLVDGSTRDLNLMLRGGRGVMRIAEGGVAWESPFTLRALFTSGPGRWVSDTESRRLKANTLLWSDAASPAAWSFEPDEPNAQAWWLGFSPEGLR